RAARITHARNNDPRECLTSSPVSLYPTSGRAGPSRGLLSRSSRSAISTPSPSRSSARQGSRRRRRASGRTCTRARGRPRAAPVAAISELLSPDDVADDQDDGKAREDRREQEEEPCRGAGQLGGVPAEVVDRVDAGPLARRTVLPDPPDDRQREHEHEAPHPG